MPLGGTITAVISTDFQLGSDLGAHGEALLQGSGWVSDGEAVSLGSALQVLGTLPCLWKQTLNPRPQTVNTVP
jgi:hypothetical protein